MELVVVESPEIILAKRIRVLISVTGLTRDECYETIMSVKNPPTVEEFYLAYSAAVILTGTPIAQRFECTSCDDKGCGFCIPCEPHGQSTE